MRLASINLQKGLNTKARRESFERWLEAWDPDLLLIQEPCAHGGQLPQSIGDYRLIGGNTFVATYSAIGVNPPSTVLLDERIQQAELGGVTVCNAYFPHESKGARAQLFRLVAERLNPGEKGALVLGDFNMAPRPEDGRFGEDEAKNWTGSGERSALKALLAEHDLVDLFVDRGPEVEPFTFERMNAGKMTRFRCDFVLASLELSKAAETALFIVHDSRRGKHAFTDHSAIVLDTAGPLRAARSAAPLKQTSASVPWRRERQFEFITDTKTLRDRVAQIAGASVVGLDVETEIYTKKPRLCLVQLAVADRVFIIDALGIDDLSPLRDVLENPTMIKVIHHAAAERTALGRVGLKILNVYDTEIRSRQTRGGRNGHTLAEVAERELSRRLDKSAQRSDWTTRPLTAAQLDYAAVDAEVLLALYAKFEQQDPVGPQALLFVM